MRKRNSFHIISTILAKFSGQLSFRNSTDAVAYSEACQTSKTEPVAKIVSSF